LIRQFQLRQEDVAAKVGRSRVAVANALRLLRLPPQIQAWLRDGKLSAGHAKAILGLSDAAAQLRAASRVIQDGWSVRQIEEFVTRQPEGEAAAATHPRAGAGAGGARSPHVADLESRLQERFGTRVQVRYRQGKGAVEIRFFNDDDLERILQIVGVKID
ncbi:MAG: chromosome partitioning protein ParB, partial [Verrucomicrobia bacterium]|nr:chromosome partitioning protein ParB [Verrucomicrobiota bacterium]